MTEEITAPAPEPTKPSLGRRIVMFPLARIIIAILFIAVPTALLNLTLRPLGHLLFPDERPILWVSLMWTLSAIVVAFAYFAFVRLIERRPVREFSFQGAFRELWIGYLIGVGLMVSSIGIMWMLGYYRITGTDSLLVLIAPFFAMAFTAVFEEVVFRGVIFRIIHESLGSWIAIIISALLFGFAHGANPNASLFSSIAIALEAGVLLSAIYLYTNRLWMVIGIHASWNLFQGNILGVAVSGSQMNSVLKAELNGPPILTGGAFGGETSIITIIICTVTGVVFLVLAHRRGHIQKPFWKRKPSSLPKPQMEDPSDIPFSETDSIREG